MMKLTYEANGKKYEQFLTDPIQNCSIEENIAHQMRFETIDLIFKICSIFKSDAQTEQANALMKAHIQKYKSLELKDEIS